MAGRSHHSEKPSTSPTIAGLVERVNAKVEQMLACCCIPDPQLSHCTNYKAIRMYMYIYVVELQRLIVCSAEGVRMLTLRQDMARHMFDSLLCSLLHQMQGSMIEKWYFLIRMLALFYDHHACRARACKELSAEYR